MNYFIKDDRQARERVQAEASRMIADIFGYNALLFGEMYGYELLRGSRIAKKWRVSDSLERSNEIDLVTDLNYLGVGSETIDLIVLPFILEFIKSPYALLDNMSELLVSDGSLLLIGVQSWSFGQNSCFSELNEIFQSDGVNLLKMKELSYILSSCNLMIEQTEFFYFGALLDKLNKGEEKKGKFSYRRIVFSLGGIYLLLAKKKSMPVTSVRNLWRKNSEITKSRLVGTR